VPLNSSNISEIIRTLSPGRFRRFIEGVLDIERRHYFSREEQDFSPKLSSFGLSKEEIVPPDLRRSLLRYVNRSVSGWGYLRAEITNFILIHHVPSLIQDLDYVELFRRDLKELTRSTAAYKALRADASHENVAFYYGTNKDIPLHWRENAEGWTETLAAAESEAGLPFSIDCIDPYTIASTLDKFPENESLLLSTLNQPDGLSIETTESGISVRPFIACDVLSSVDSENGYVLNVDATPLAASRISALQGLEDILTLVPDERHIESFLIAHPDVLLGLDYLGFRAQVTIAPTGERPDFFLERVDGLWDVLELKKPMPALFLEQLNAYPTIARYLEESVKQCVKYLRLLETNDARKRLLDKGIRIEEPRVTLLVGRQQYPSSVVDLIHSSYDRRIIVRSYDELYVDCKRHAALVLSQMKDLAAKRH